MTEIEGNDGIFGGFCFEPAPLQKKSLPNKSGDGHLEFNDRRGRA